MGADKRVIDENELILSAITGNEYFRVSAPPYNNGSTNFKLKVSVLKSWAGGNARVVPYTDGTTMDADVTVYPVGSIGLLLSTFEMIPANGLDTFGDIYSSGGYSVTQSDLAGIYSTIATKVTWAPAPLTIAAAQAVDAVHGWDPFIGNYYMIRDTTGNFSGGNSLHTYIAQVIRDEHTGYGKLATTGVGYVRDFVGTGVVDSLCIISYDVTVDQWTMCNAPVFGIEAEAEDGVSLNQINYGAWSECEISNCAFSNIDSTFGVGAGCRLYNMQIDGGNKANCTLSAVKADSGFINYFADNILFSQSVLNFSSTTNLYSSTTLLTLGVNAIFSTSENDLYGATIGDSSTVNLGQGKGNNPMQFTIGSYKTVDMTALTNYIPPIGCYYEGVTSNFPITSANNSHVNPSGGALDMGNFAFAGDLIVDNGTGGISDLQNMTGDHNVTISVNGTSLIINTGIIGFYSGLPSPQTLANNDDFAVFTMRNSKVYLKECYTV